MNHDSSTLRIHKFLPTTEAEGPGIRACLWVQGCPIHCKGCGVPWTWSFEDGTLIPVADLVERILNGPNVEGVTFLGGEPFAQAGSLATLAEHLKANGLSIMTFSGYTLEHIRQVNHPDWNRLVAVTDLLIDGPFVEEQLDLSRPWVGSLNQRYHFLTDRYRHLEHQLHTIPNRIEIRIAPNGSVSLNGMGTSKTFAELAGVLQSKE